MGPACSQPTVVPARERLTMTETTKEIGHCVGDGTMAVGVNCDGVGSSGYSCPKCGGMVLSKKAIADAERLHAIWARENREAQ